MQSLPETYKSPSFISAEYQQDALHRREDPFIRAIAALPSGRKPEERWNPIHATRCLGSVDASKNADALQRTWEACRGRTQGAVGSRSIRMAVPGRHLPTRPVAYDNCMDDDDSSGIAIWVDNVDHEPTAQHGEISFYACSDHAQCSHRISTKIESGILSHKIDKDAVQALLVMNVGLRMLSLCLSWTVTTYQTIIRSRALMHFDEIRMSGQLLSISCLREAYIMCSASLSQSLQTFEGQWDFRKWSKLPAHVRPQTARRRWRMLGISMVDCSLHSSSTTSRTCCRS
jgi:hypothetical protein